MAFVSAYPNCFERSLSIGHITGSAWLVNQTKTRVLLTHHKRLNKWLQLGGHADGNPNVLEVAMQEAREESGIEGFYNCRWRCRRTTDLYYLNVELCNLLIVSGF